MQDVPPLTTLRDNLYVLIAGILASVFTAGGIVGVFIKWLLDRPKTKAELIQIHATSVKIEAEAKETTTRTILAAQARIVELVDINSELQGELTEAERQRDNHEFDLRQTQFQIQQLENEQRLDKLFIAKLQAASELGVKLQDLPADQPKDQNLVRD